jgi:hypothetical protein
MMQDERIADYVRQAMQGNMTWMTRQEDRGGGHSMMPRAVAMLMMAMTRINPCSGKEDAMMMTRINPSCTRMRTCNEPSGGNGDQGEQRHNHTRSRRNN